MNSRGLLVLLPALLACAAEQSGPEAPSGGASGRDDVAGAICQGCEPEGLGGDTGDFGGTPTICGGLLISMPIEAPAAVALGFDVAEMERRLARPIDESFAWRSSPYGVPDAGGEATGYSPSTRVRATVRSAQSYRLRRPDPARCDGTTCRVNGEDYAQAKCPLYLDTDVDVQVETADGALRASLPGVAFFAIAGSEGEGKHFASRVAINARVKLSEVTGTLRIYPRPGADQYRASLQFEALLEQESSSGDLRPSVMVNRGTTNSYYQPLSGSFPPVMAIPSADAGAPRK